jgi:predicted PurR-regulated permease PerM
VTSGPGVSSGLGGPTKRKVFLAVSGAVAVAVLVAASQVLLPFILALVVAYVLTPAVRRVERRMPRWVAILLVYAVTLGTLGLFVSRIVPRLVAEGHNLGEELPVLNRSARETWLPALDAKLNEWSGHKPEAVPPPDTAADQKPAPFRVVARPDGSYDVVVSDGVRFRETREGVWEIEEIDRSSRLSSAAMLQEGFEKGLGYLRENSYQLLKIGQRIASAVSAGIFNLFMTLMLGGYLILTHEKIIAFFRALVAPPDRGSFDRFVRRLDRGLSGVVRGQLIICAVNGVLSAVGFSLFGLKYWPIMALVSAVMSLIPIFGSILSAIPAVAIGLTQSPATAFGVLAWIVGIHQLEANLLNPKIIGDAAKIHPVLVVFSLLAGEHFFQITGALFAVPCMSIVQTIFLHFRESSLGIEDPTASVLPVPQVVEAGPDTAPAGGSRGATGA